MSQFGVGIIGSSSGSSSSGRGVQGHALSQPKRVGAGNIPPKSAQPASPYSMSPPKFYEEAGSTSTLTNTSNQQSTESKDSTLRYSDFESDSLEQYSPSPTMGQAVEMGTKLNPLANRGAEHSPPSSFLPPVHPQHSNVMVSYANAQSSSTLSPIWNRRLLLQDESESGSDFITSPIGELNPLPKILSPDYKPEEERPFFINRRGSDAGVYRRGSNSGHPRDSDLGEHRRRGSDVGRSCRKSSDSGWHGTESVSRSDGSSELNPALSLSEHSLADEGKEGCIVWKKGKMLGRGAYGRVWEGLYSARMIAVKEVELDTYDLERAKSVRYRVHVMSCVSFVTHVSCENLSCSPLAT